MTDIRRASHADTPHLAGTLARAFHDDPVFAWMIPDESRRARRAERLFATRLRHIVRQDDSWTTHDLAGAALWAQPDAWRVSVREFAELVLQTIPHARHRTPTLARGLHSIEKAHPAEPAHYYLAVLGTDPSRQGEGIGSRLLAPVLERCDADGVGAYLESSKERNIAFYSRHGFRVTGEVRLPGGPTVWPMWRDPR